MIYQHELEERKPNLQAMCTSLPPVDPDYEAMRDYLQQRKLSYDLAVMNGWYQSYQAGDHYLRMVIPAVTHVPGHIFWQARDMTGNAHRRYQSPTGPRHEALVTVTPEDEPKGVVIVEGPTDALAAAGEGYLGIALMGMLPSSKTVAHLVKLIPNKVKVLVLLDRDSEASGPRLSWKLATHGIRSHVAFLPGPEKDIAACPPIKRAKFLKTVFSN